jgi:hypothetical protein
VLREQAFRFVPVVLCECWNHVALFELEVCAQAHIESLPKLPDFGRGVRVDGFDQAVEQYIEL